MPFDEQIRGHKRSLAANVRRLRIAAGLTQEQLAERCEIDEKHLQKIETTRTNPSLETIVCLAAALGVEISELFKPARYMPPRRGRPLKSR